MALVGHHPELGELYRRFASPPIRNAGTLGGNIANGSPIGDSMPALIVMGATLILRKGGRTRELPLDEFYLAYQKTALDTDYAPLTDMRASATYRRSVARNLLRKCWIETSAPGVATQVIELAP
jgi:xanthine dehydrogenase iron-sulfur cluster and FAD-binding subunit A